MNLRAMPVPMVGAGMAGIVAAGAFRSPALAAVSGALCVVGLGIWLYRIRPQRYSLKALNSMMDEAPDVGKPEGEPELLYCQHCGCAYPADFRHCPNCR